MPEVLFFVDGNSSLMESPYYGPENRREVDNRVGVWGYR